MWGVILAYLVEIDNAYQINNISTSMQAHVVKIAQEIHSVDFLKECLHFVQRRTKQAKDIFQIQFCNNGHVQRTKDIVLTRCPKLKFLLTNWMKTKKY